MENKSKYIFEKVSAYADKVLDGIDPQKVQISYQLEKLKPIMEELSKELNKPIEDIFIEYMDEASNAGLESEKKFQSTMGDMTKYGDPMSFEQF
ncbi:MAG: hypothetical protein J6X48_10755 [Lachnospiraceae bacterium]|jgi:hypothetical protein|nr:hypothetical protein [Lachnospiraceae bacterium]MBP5600732.1 hypothetical protein [Lachnospiraceae bacterium]